MKNILLLLLIVAFAGCQPSPKNTVDQKRRDAAHKLFAQSMIMLEQKDLKGAVASLEAAIKVDPTDPNPYLMLGQILLKAGEYNHAVEFLDQTAKNFPDNGTVFYMLSVANKMAGKTLPAVLTARRSFEIFKIANDKENAQASAILLEDLIKQAKEQEQNQQTAQAGSSQEEDSSDNMEAKKK